MGLASMSKARRFFPVIVASIISGIVVFPVLSYFFSVGFIIFLAPIVIAILLSLISGYIFTPFDRNEKYPFGTLIVLATGTFLLAAYIITSIILESRDCSGYKCGTFPEPLMPYVIFCPIITIFGPFIGLCTTFFYKMGMKIKLNKFEKNQAQREWR